MERIGLPFPWGIVPAERIFRVVIGDDPVAGAEVSVTVPGGVLWIVRTFTTRLVTDATVANRRPGLQMDDGTTLFANAPVSWTATATQTPRITWMVGFGVELSAGSGNFRGEPMPEVPLFGGYRIRTNTEGLVAGDNYDAPVLYVAEYNIRGLERALERYDRAAAEALAGGG